MEIDKPYINTIEQEHNRFGYSFLPGLLFASLIWLIHLLAYLTDADLAWLGVLPRNFFGLVGVFLSPLIHSSLLHLLSNTFPLILLSGFIIFIHRTAGLRVLLLIYILSGILTWFIGRQAYHIGASGVVYGMAGFLLFRGFYTRDRSSMAIAFAILFLYSGLFYGLFPNEERVSWEGHLGGLIAGLVAVFSLGKDEAKVTNESKVTVTKTVAQRHVSSTFIPEYTHYTIGYSLQEPGTTKKFVYKLTPDTRSKLT
jgi:membrane associated rhomboid family serine protease